MSGQISRSSLCETQVKRLFGRNPNRGWCHRQTTSLIKLYLVAAYGSMGIGGIIRVKWKLVDELAYNRRETRYKRSLSRDPDRNWCHSHTSVVFSVAALVPCCCRCSWSHGLRSKGLLPSVTLTPTPARVPTQRPLFPSFTSVWARLELFTLPSYCEY